MTLEFTYACGTCIIFGSLSLSTVLMWITQVMNGILIIGYIIFLIAVKGGKYVRRKKRFTSTDVRLVCISPESIYSILIKVLCDG